MRQRPPHLPAPEPRGAPAFRDLGEARTDLAIESLQAASPSAGRRSRADGVEIDEERSGGVDLNRVRVLSPAGERLVGKPRGTYITLDAPQLRQRDTEVQETVARLLAAELRRLLQLKAGASVFVVGLGNWNATPDALGPKVVEHVLVTRHLQGQVPSNLRGELRPVAALAPGVLGLTGIETGDIIRGIVERIRPDAVIVVDALASRSIERILRTIQLADTGIRPGSGVGNHRAGIDQAVLGVPVVAMGVPTVVHAATIAADAMELLADRLGEGEAARALRALLAEDKRGLIAEVLDPAVGDLMVTPKEIDALVDDMAKVLAAGINAALHPKVAAQELLLG